MGQEQCKGYVANSITNPQLPVCTAKLQRDLSVEHCSLTVAKADLNWQEGGGI